MKGQIQLTLANMIKLLMLAILLSLSGCHSQSEEQTMRFQSCVGTGS